MRLFILIFFLFSFQLFSLNRAYLDKLNWKMDEKAVHRLERGSKFNGKEYGDSSRREAGIDGVYGLEFRRKIFGVISPVHYFFSYFRYRNGKKIEKLYCVYFHLLKGVNKSSLFNKKFYVLGKKLSAILGKPYKEELNTLTKKYNWKYKDKKIALLFEEKAYAYDCKIYLEITPHK